MKPRVDTAVLGKVSSMHIATAVVMLAGLFINFFLNFRLLRNPDNRSKVTLILATGIGLAICAYLVLRLEEDPNEVLLLLIWLWMFEGVGIQAILNWKKRTT